MQSVRYTPEFFLQVACGVDGDIEAVKNFIHLGADISSDNYRALSCAVQWGHIEIVKLLLESQRHPPEVILRSLRIASEGRHTDIIKLLREY